MAVREIRSSFHILNHLGVGQNARGGLVALHPRSDQLNSSRTGQEQCSQRRRIQKIAPHSSMGGVGLLSCRIRSSAATISSQSRSLQAPITPKAFWVALRVTAASAAFSSVKQRTTSWPFSSKISPI